jgi:hypothetical protein
MTKFVLCLRTCSEALTSHGGFQWPKKGPIACTDWLPKPECGNGLHGLLWGVGDAGYLDYCDTSKKWLVVKVRAEDVVDIQNKVKFPRGQVVFCGTRDRAVVYIQKRAPKGSNVVFGKFPRRFKSVKVGGIKSVRDSLTGLTWQAEGSDVAMNHADATKYCASLGAGWRMPTEPELRTIVDYRGTTHKIDARFFKCNGWWYWTSTPYAPSSGCAWGVYFDDGGSDDLNRDNRGCVRAVRSSQ